MQLSLPPCAVTCQMSCCRIAEVPWSLLVLTLRRFLLGHIGFLVARLEWHFRLTSAPIILIVVKFNVNVGIPSTIDYLSRYLSRPVSHHNPLCFLIIHPEACHPATREGPEDPRREEHRRQEGDAAPSVDAVVVVVLGTLVVVLLLR